MPPGISLFVSLLATNPVNWWKLICHSSSGDLGKCHFEKNPLKNYFSIYSFTFGCTGVLLLHVGANLCCRAWALGVWASLVVTHGLLLLHSMWDLPRRGMEPVSPALAGRFLTIRTKKFLLKKIKWSHITSYLRIIFHINFILALIFISKDGKTIVKHAATLLTYGLKDLHCFAKWKQNLKLSSLLSVFLVYISNGTHLV